MDANDNVVDDAYRILRARIIGGENDMVGQAAGDFSHHGALGPVAITPAAEDDNHAALGQLPGRLQEVGKGQVGVCEIHHDGERLTQSDGFKAAWDTLERADTGGDGAEGKPQPKGGGRRGQKVVKVRAPNQGRFHGDGAIGRRQGEPGAAKAQACALDRDGFAVPLDAVEKDFSLGHLLQLEPVRIVSVEYGQGGWLRPSPQEELLLGLKVILHGLVEVQVVASQVGENGRSKGTAVDAIENQAMGRDLHHRPARAGIAQFGQETLQVKRLRRGLASGNDTAGGVVFHRAEQPHALTGGPEY
jgi:hypothetical protein